MLNGAQGNGLKKKANASIFRNLVEKFKNVIDVIFGTEISQPPSETKEDLRYPQGVSPESTSARSSLFDFRFGHRE